ncbi:MAG: hypothetical protein JWR08_1828 [Enterovirga sp.]|nr:hypothetical protein [Enterovirga sp.]
MAKKPKTKTPKTIAGFKVPKSLRKAGLLDALVGTPAGRKLLGDALVAAAGAAAAALAAGGASGARRANGKAPDGAGSALATFVTEGAKAMLPQPDADETPTSRKTPKRGDATRVLPDATRVLPAAETASGKRAGRRKASSANTPEAAPETSEPPAAGG